jgi:hypothetical protein
MKIKLSALLVIFLLGACLIGGCSDISRTRSGIRTAESNVQVQSSGKTIEQENISRRLELENRPGSIKHLYALSSMSGQCILYSTVKGKVTSSEKRLAPNTTSWVDSSSGFRLPFGDRYVYTNEVMSDDGTYGKSIDYLFWWDVNDRYFQIYPTGLAIIVSDFPLPIKAITINLSVSKE